MAKGMYMGISSVARKIKKGYIGIDGVARKIKKMYIGISNVARLFFSSGFEVNTPISLSFTADIFEGSAASTTSYACFQYGNSLNAYNTSLTKTTKTMKGDFLDRAGCSFNGSALFYGGQFSSNEHSSTNKLSIIDNSLTETSNRYLGQPCYRSGGATVGNYAIFAGGYYYELGDDDYWHGDSRAIATAVNTSYSATNMPDLHYPDCDMHTASLNSYAIFTGSFSGLVTAYNASGIRQQYFTKTNQYSVNSAMASVGGLYALLVQGSTSSSRNQMGNTTTVDVWNNSLTKSTTSISSNKACMCGISTSIYAVFKGGYGSGAVQSEIELFDSSLTRQVFSESSFATAYCLGTSIGNIVFMASGHYVQAGAKSSTVEVINFNS